MADKVSASGDTHGGQHDLIAKIVCLFFALVLWIYVMDVENPDWEVTVEDVPVVLKNTDDIEIDNDLTVYGGYDETINITLRGKKNEVSEIAAEDITATVDVSSITEAGEYPLPISITVPNDAEIVSSTTDTVTVSVDRRERITVDVRPKYGEFVIEQGYTQGTPELSVDQITVTGPSRYLSEIDHAEVIMPDLGRVTSSITVYGHVALIDRNGGVVTNPYVTMSATDVSVNVPIYAIKAVPLTVRYKYGFYNEENVELTLDKNTVNVRGDPSVINSLDSIVIATIDEKSIMTDEWSGTATIVLPDGVEKLDDFDTVNITIRNVGTITRQIVVPLSVLNVINPNGVAYSLSRTTVTVTLRGDPGEIYSVSAYNIKASIDLSAYDGNQSVTQSVPIVFEFMATETVYELDEYNVDVIINPASAE